MLIMGTMIGSGIFVVSATLAQDVGSSGWLMAAWVLTGVMTVVGALSYAELAGMMPHAGGQYVYLREAYSPMPGFLYGWTCFLIIQTGSSPPWPSSSPSIWACSCRNWVPVTCCGLSTN